MVKDDDDLSQVASVTRGDAGWGGARQSRWHQAGKRAVVMVDPQVYEMVVVLARLCHRPIRDLTPQIFAAGMEALTGRPIEDLRLKKFMVSLGQQLPTKRAFTNEEVQERFGLLQEVRLVPVEEGP